MNTKNVCDCHKIYLVCHPEANKQDKNIEKHDTGQRSNKSPKVVGLKPAHIFVAISVAGTIVWEASLHQKRKKFTLNIVDKSEFGQSGLLDPQILRFLIAVSNP